MAAAGATGEAGAMVDGGATGEAGVMAGADAKGEEGAPAAEATGEVGAIDAAGASGAAGVTGAAVAAGGAGVRLPGGIASVAAAWDLGVCAGGRGGGSRKPKALWRSPAGRGGDAGGGRLEEFAMGCVRRVYLRPSRTDSTKSRRSLPKNSSPSTIKLGTPKTPRLMASSV